MFVILGIESDSRQTLLGTPSSAREARTKRDEALVKFSKVVIQDSSGKVIEQDVLNALAEAEEES